MALDPTGAPLFWAHDQEERDDDADPEPDPPFAVLGFQIEFGPGGSYARAKTLAIVEYPNEPFAPQEISDSILGNRLYSRRWSFVDMLDMERCYGSVCDYPGCTWAAGIEPTL